MTMQTRQWASTGSGRPPVGIASSKSVRAKLDGPKLMIQAQAKAIEDNLRPVRACDTNRRTLLAGLAGPFVAGPALLLLAPPSADAKTATPVAPVDVVKQVLTKLDDIDTVVAKQSKSVVWKLPAAYPGDPVGGEFKGRYGVLRYMTRHKSYYKNAKISDLKVTPGDGKDQVIARYRFSGNVASGGKFSTSVTQVWRVDPEGSVTSMKAYYDTASLAKAAGKVVA